MTEPLNLSVVMGSIERRGAWTVPSEVNARVLLGSLEMDLREAELGPETTIDASIMFGSLELIVPRDVVIDVNVDSFAGSVEHHASAAPPLLAAPAIDDAPSTDTVGQFGAYRDPVHPVARRLKITGKARFGSCEIIPLDRGETIHDHARRLREELRRARHGHHHHRHHQHHRRFHGNREERRKAMEAEREIWRAHPDRSPWMPWWLQARMRRRIFSWFAIAFVLGVVAGVYFWPDHRWWHFVIAAIGLSVMSGSIAWRLTRPLILVIQAARDIGDGKLDTRLDIHQRGEMKILAMAINDMASRIEQQLKDQRQLLAAVSHELRTPLGHMRVLIETARDTHDPKTLAELDREVLTLDDLVGRLLASSRLEFGSLDKRTIDLGELISDLATQAGVSPDAIEADDNVKAAVDPTLVRRAIANLLDNAKTHGGGAVAIRVVRRGPQIAIEVDDAGPGVPKDRRADAFRAFVPSSGGGLGLGLALVSRIAVAHEGGAYIHDRPGGGARVGFTLTA
jgi:signal transduction histidine kinase